jgi:hypothetical protein
MRFGVGEKASARVRSISAMACNTADFLSEQLGPDAHSHGTLPRGSPNECM